MFNILCAFLSAYGAITSQWWMLWVFLSFLFISELVEALKSLSELALEKEKNKLKEVIKEKLDE